MFSILKLLLALYKRISLLVKQLFQCSNDLKRTHSITAKSITTLFQCKILSSVVIKNKSIILYFVSKYLKVFLLPWLVQWKLYHKLDTYKSAYACRHDYQARLGSKNFADNQPVGSGNGALDFSFSAVSCFHFPLLKLAFSRIAVPPDRRYLLRQFLRIGSRRPYFILKIFNLKKKTIFDLFFLYYDSDSGLTQVQCHIYVCTASFLKVICT